MKKNERLQALQILTRLLQDQLPLSVLMPPNESHSPLTKELCFGVCRHYFRLALMMDSLLSKRPKTIDVWLCLMLGIYQLHYLRIPDYAVVKETVALLGKIKRSWAKGLVNATLRTYCRDKEQLLAHLENHPTFIYGHPEWFIHQMQTSWPLHWQDILKANDIHPPMSLRVNQRQTTLDAYLTDLAEAQIDAMPLNDSKQGIVITKPCHVQDLPGFMTGKVSVQDEAAQLAASLLQLKSGQRVLDACAAPGGKTCHILESEPQLSACLAIDIDSKRIQRIQDNLTRLRLQATLLEGDALKPQDWWDGKLFDRILLDAPCSATGVIRRHPDIKLLRKEEEILAVTTIQQGILRALWPLLKPGGILVYATCSVIPLENEQQIAQFVENQSDCQCITEDQAFGHRTPHGWQILPGEHNMDGFFYSVLTKK